jgi:hypothetical protein
VIKISQFKSMEKEIRDRIERAIAASGKTNKEACDALGISLRTLTRRRQIGDYSLSELIRIESIFDVNIFHKEAKYGAPNANPGMLNEEEERYGGSGYRIKIEIDPDRFSEEDLAALNDELTNKLLRNFRKKDAN